jgi:hypothetical protein
MSTLFHEAGLAPNSKKLSVALYTLACLASNLKQM